MKVTIYDIAREAGVSIATVSQVINGKGKISPKKIKEIIDVMERLNYMPSGIASALAGKNTYTIGLLVPDISNPFFAEIARAIEDQGSHLGYSIMICSTDNKDESVKRYLSLLQQKRVDGIIIGTGIKNHNLWSPILMRSIPIVMLAREVTSFDVQTVIVDDFAGGNIAAKHLMGLGHTRLAVISESMEVSSSRERIRGLKQAMEENGLTFNEQWLKESGSRLVEDGRSLALELLQAKKPPTAIFCLNDLLAIGALQAAKELEISVPSQLSIIGFDNTILASVTDPPLTTIAQPIEMMGKMAVNLLMKQLENKLDAKEDRTVLVPKLVERRSTAVLS